MRVGVALGSNLGDRRRNLRGARDAVMALSDVEPGSCLTAPIHETAPVNCPPGAGVFFNSVIEFGYRSDPEKLLDELLGIEAGFGRARQTGRSNEPRPLDLDLLYAGDLTRRTPVLTLPHPRMFQRRFVLAPLAQIRPELILTGQTKSVAELLACLDDDPSTVALAAEQW